MDKHIVAMKALRDLRAYEEVLNQEEIDAIDWVISEIERLRDLADEHNRLIRHMDAGGDFFAFQVAEAGRRNAPVPNS